MRILAGDIGGTNVRLALFDSERPRVPDTVQIYPSSRFSGLEQFIHEFLDTQKTAVDALCVGVAGPVRDGRSRLTNLPWTVDSAALAKAVGTPHAWVINDLEATAWGIEVLGEEDCVVLNAGNPGATGNRAVLAAGTGLGEAGLYWDGMRHHPFATEGGHASFAPGNQLDTQFLAWLWKQFGHASWERVVSGAGIVNLYRFLRETQSQDATAWEVEEIPTTGEDAGPIADAAVQGRSHLCTQAMQMFARFYGAEAANLGLKLMARGGIYLAGGIAPKNLELLQSGEFLHAFLDKGRMRSLLEEMPVRIITYPHVGLSGAARCAASRAI